MLENYLPKYIFQYLLKTEEPRQSLTGRARFSFLFYLTAPQS